MADNFQANPGAGGDTFAADDVGGVKYPYSKIDIGAGGVSSPVTAANPLPVELSSSQVTIATTPIDYYPSYGGVESTATNTLYTDPDGSLVTRGAVLTDEGTFRVNFANASLASAIGNVTVSGSTVTGTGFVTASTKDVHKGAYFKLDADGESAWAQIESIDSDTQLTLTDAYAGGTSGAASRSLVKPQTGSGGSITVASGACTLASGTTNAASTRIYRSVDYAPLIYRAAFSISQRIANQDIYAGLSEPDTVTDRWYARFRFNGTTNTTVICESARNPTTTPSGNEIQTTTVTLPAGVTTAISAEYRVELLTERVAFYVNGILVANHSRVIPAQHDEMEASVRVLNGTGAASSTNVVVDYLTTKNHNKLEIGVLSDTETIVAQQPDYVPTTYSVAGVIAINTVLMQIDCTRYRSLSIQCTSMGTTGVVTPEWSNDGATWVAASISTPAGAAATTFNAAGMWTTPVCAKNFRLRLSTATTAGTTTLNVQASQAPTVPLPTQPVSGTVTANIGTGSIAAGTNAIGDVGIQYRANATGAATTFKFASAATVNNALILTGARRLLGWSLTNTTTSFKYFRFYNKATAPTSGESPTFIIGLPPNSTVVSPPIVGGIAMSLGLGIACTGAVADTDATVTAANDVVGAIHYA